MAYEARFTKQGNIKVGGETWTFNKLAGSGVMRGVLGSCNPKYCDGGCYNPENPAKSPCYVFKSYIRYGKDGNMEDSSVCKGHVRNTVAMRKSMADSFKELHLQIKRAKKKPTLIRIHASGELECKEELRGWVELAKKWPEINFYVYTKAFDVLHEFFTTYNLSKIPSNFTVLVSIWHEKGIATYNEWKHLPCVKAYVYMDDYEYDLDLSIKCPAYDENGKMNHDMTCDICGLCYNPKVKVIGCYDHSQKKKAKAKKIKKGISLNK